MNESTASPSAKASGSLAKSVSDCKCTRQSESAKVDHSMARRKPKCARCLNHSVMVPVKGHKLVCQFKLCRCKKCRLVDKRQKIMAKQVKVRRYQQSHGNDATIIHDILDDENLDDEDEEDEKESATEMRLSTEEDSNQNENSSALEVPKVILDAFHASLMIRLSGIAPPIAFEIATRMAATNIFELASIKKLDPKAFLEHKTNAAVGQYERNCSNHYLFREFLLRDSGSGSSLDSDDRLGPPIFNPAVIYPRHSSSASQVIHHQFAMVPGPIAHFGPCTGDARDATNFVHPRLP